MMVHSIMVTMMIVTSFVWMGVEWTCMASRGSRRLLYRNGVYVVVQLDSETDRVIDYRETTNKVNAWDMYRVGLGLV